MMKLDINDKYLPPKITASFILSAAAITLPIGLMDIVRMEIENPVVRSGVRLVVDGAVFYGSYSYLKKTLKNLAQEVVTQLNPLHKADLSADPIGAISGVDRTIFSGLASGLMINGAF